MGPVTPGPGRREYEGRAARPSLHAMVTAVNQTVLFSAAKLLVLLHAAAAIVLIGSSTHNFLVTLGYLRGAYNVRLGRIYAATVAVAYGVTFVLGALAYPTYRYYVRGLYFDRYAIWASNLFDMKENFASIGLPLVLGAFLLSRVMDPKEDGQLLPGYAVMVGLTSLIVWFNVISGLLITMTRGV
jgi:hypothetical protein